MFRAAKKWAVCVGVLCSVFSSYSQVGFIKGKVLSDQKPVVGANVVLQQINKGAVTDSLGSFELAEIPGGRYNLRISAIGYQYAEERINMKNDSLDLLCRCDCI